MSKIEINTFFCTRCGYEQPVSTCNMPRLSKSALQGFWCIRCKKVTPHQNTLYHKNNINENNKVTASVDCSEIAGNNIENLQWTSIKCTCNDGLFIIFKSIGDAANFILLNSLSSSKRLYILNRIRRVLRHETQSVYGLKFSFIFKGLNGNFCLEPVGYCKLKACYLSEADAQQNNCEQKQCQNLIKGKVFKEIKIKSY